METYLFEYDGHGNIICKYVCEYSTTDELVLKDEIIYTYNKDYKDLLTNYNGKKIEYNELYNPVVYCGNDLSWDFRNLVQFEGVKFKYNSFWLRVSKESSDSEHKYILDGSRIIKEVISEYDTAIGDSIDEFSTVSVEEISLEYIYDSSGVIGFN